MILETDIKECAIQLTIGDWKMFNKLKFEEFHGQAWFWKGKEEISPNGFHIALHRTNQA
ncbi:RasGEF domain-containing protein [Patescibacteria group bacterium]|nr:RasGEF domain-containing protein [Patescibacteria group bacterium]